MHADELKFMKKELHYRLGKKTMYHFSEIVKIVNEFFDELAGNPVAAPEDPTTKAMRASEEEFEEIKKEAGIAQPPEPAKKPKAPV